MSEQSLEKNKIEGYCFLIKNDRVYVNLYVGYLLAAKKNDNLPSIPENKKLTYYGKLLYNKKKMNAYEMAYGTNIIEYKNHVLTFVLKKRKGKIENNWPQEKLQVYINCDTFAKADELLTQFINSAKLHYRDIPDDKLYTQLFKKEWIPLSELPEVDLENFIMEENKKKKIINTIENFYTQNLENSKKKNKKIILISGDTGTGKTKLILSLANHFKKNICYLNIYKELDDNLFNWAFRSLDNQNFVVIENIDEFFQGEKINLNMKTLVTFNFFLSFLDGLISNSNKIIFLITNDYKNLNYMVKRIGRIDEHIELGQFNKNDIKKMVEQILPNQIQHISTIIDKISKKNVNPAILEKFLCENNATENILDKIDDLIKYLDETSSVKNRSVLYS